MNGVPTYHTQLLSKANVVGVGVGRKVMRGEEREEQAVSVLVERKLPREQLAAQDVVPAEIACMPTDVVEVGKLTAPPPDLAFPLLSVEERRKVMRPAQPGCSVGHVNCTAGTFGLVVRHNLDAADKRYLLSNNHVFGMSNEAEHGDSIVQPGPYDGGVDPRDRIGFLSRYVPISFSGDVATCKVAKWVSRLCNWLALSCGSSHRLNAVVAEVEPNYVDAALAWPISDGITPEILDIGEPGDLGRADIGTPVQKSGRTTGYTTGRVTQIEATVRVDYGGKVALFADQLVAVGDGCQMSAGGDSGSAILDMNRNVVGLLFAGSPQVTIFNPFRAVASSLNIRIWR